MTIKGHAVPFIRIEPEESIAREFYLSLTVSREKKCFLLTVGRQGGVDVESLGADNLLVQEVHLPAGLASHQIRAAFFHLELGKEFWTEFHEILTKLYRTMLEFGLLMAEINPLILNEDGKLLALDAKVEVDDNFADLVPEMEGFYQREHATAEENMARDAGLSFVRLPGWVGLMVNGAGLAMATMDILNLAGLTASNFLDLGGGADQTRMGIAFDLLFGDSQVEVIFINLFGGILSCKKVALAMQGALDGKPSPKPIVVRMAGKDSVEGLEILRALPDDNLHIVADMKGAMDFLRPLKPDDVLPPEEPPAGRAHPPSACSGPPYISDAVFPIDKATPILIQGITGKEGQLHAQLMLEYGANVVAGVTPFKGGQEVLGVPVYNSIAEAKANHVIEASIIFVPPRMAADAIMEAASNEIPWAVCITEGIVQHEMLAVVEQLKNSPTRLIGPNTPASLYRARRKSVSCPRRRSCPDRWRSCPAAAPSPMKWRTV